MPLVSFTHRIAFGAAASWFSRGLAILMELVLMPVLFRHLPKEELGVWLLLGQSWAALSILDLGFGVVFTRRIAFAAGTREVNGELTAGAAAEISDLIATGRHVYRWLAAAALVCS